MYVYSKSITALHLQKLRATRAVYLVSNLLGLTTAEATRSDRNLLPALFRWNSSNSSLVAQLKISEASEKKLEVQEKPRDLAPT